MFPVQWYLIFQGEEAAAAVVEDAKEIQQGRPYHWKDWCTARGRDCLYIWSESAALELSNGSNGWFRFIIDSKLQTMYSSGSPEGGSDSSGRAKQAKQANQAKLIQESPQGIITDTKL